MINSLDAISCIEGRKLISLRYIYFVKWIVPALLGFGFVGFLLLWAYPGVFDPLQMLATLLALVVCVMTLRKTIWCLADAVYDCGDFLLVRRGKIEENVFLYDITDVKVRTFYRPFRVILRLNHRGRFGNEIAFSPSKASMWNPFARIDVADDLMQRAEKARAKKSVSTLAKRR